MRNTTFTLSCADAQWQLKLELHLQNGFDVDVVDLDSAQKGPK